MFKSSALAGGFFVYIAKGKFVGLGVGLHLIWEEVSFFGFGAQLNGLLAFS